MLRWRQTLEIFENGFVWTRLLDTVSKQRGEVRATQLIENRSNATVRTHRQVGIADGGDKRIRWNSAESSA